MTLTEAMVATLVWGLTAVGVLQIWVASGQALSATQGRQQALALIDADLLRVGAQLLRLKATTPEPPGDCQAVAASLASTLAEPALAAMPGLSRRLRQEGAELWLEYSINLPGGPSGNPEERRRLLAPEAAGLCRADGPAAPGVAGAGA